MEVKTLPKQEFLVRDLSTRSVVLYPTRAHVVREINDIQLESGVNEIEIYGLTPTADEGSIKVEGTGNATISNMSVELVANKDIFLEIYPDNESEVEESEDEESDPEDQNVESIKTDLKSLKNKLARSEETNASVAKRLEFLNSYAKSADSRQVQSGDFQTILKVYRKERDDLHFEHDEAVASGEELQKQIDKLEKALKRASKPMRIEKERENKAKLKRKQQELRIKNEEKKQKNRLREERLKYWPKKVFKISLHLETSTDTPSTSRRSSVSSITLAKAPLPSKNREMGDTDTSTSVHSVSLALSYVTVEASWLPRYDVSFSTPTKTGTIVYRAEFKNQTCETWKDARISLSTSQASFQGVNDEVPHMYPWHVGLSRIGHLKGKASDVQAITSAQEISHRHVAQTQNKGSNYDRKELFGPDFNDWTIQQQAQNSLSVFNQARSLHTKGAMGTNQNNKALFGSVNTNTFSSVNKNTAVSSTPFVSANTNSFSSANNAADENGGHMHNPAQLPPDIAARHYHQVRDEQVASQSQAQRPEPICNLLDHGPFPPPNELDFEESTWEDNGLTTSYDIPGVRTLSPSSTQSQHKIATLYFKDLQLTSIAVPKLRAAAFMRARFRNPSSSVTLLKGAVGLTLDGTFLGTTTLPRVSPHETITLPLGVDPAIHIAYTKPSVRRATHGLVFNKENALTFTRSIWISNTKTTPTELVVLDQVPLSDDDKLRVDITTPSGLTREDVPVSCGVAASQNPANLSASSSSKKWGTARAMLRKNNEIRFDVSLDKGGSCHLMLEYELRTPTGETVVSKS